jgi:hypothetical protein
VRRSLHYEGAFAQYLRDRRIPYVAVDEARKALLPDSGPACAAGGSGALKSFDFVLYGPGVNLLADVKGRRLGGRRPALSTGCRTAPPGPGRAVSRPAPRSAWKGRLECWATQEDVDSLLAWERLFGDGFLAAFVFVYWCDEQPPAPLFEEVFEHRGRWYVVRAVPAGRYAASMKPRSLKWRTVDMPAAAFERDSRPLADTLAGPGVLYSAAAGQ